MKEEIEVVTGDGTGFYSRDPEKIRKGLLLGWVSVLKMCESDEEMMSVIEDIQDGYGAGEE